ncbi:uncharacterized protein SAPINGB_P003998 [Magnusiomyces paraingens]|uniref:V-type proton ATPase subunit E n=1 Tax=Magnusiomyces paraingens TaxID=2606893 RepID=A0A5E8BS96_9ASCO|nr:uncharacterized protein SAPINGB_P003998 [Saprochaete ingens]VVT54283.1 unnamed protein product [Saprochaete ingens]
MPAVASQSLSDDQVNSELQKMVEFIKKEADEKAKEIELKANEEYEIEKASVVRSETSAIDALYERKYKQAQLAQQIAKSTVANKTRLKVLEAREDVVTSVFEGATEKLKELSKDSKKYKSVLSGLIEEAALTLLEPKVRIRARKADAKIVKEAIEPAAKAYKEKSGRDVEITLDEDSELPEGSAGGVVVLNASGKIYVNNTFEERLKLLEDQSLPAIRLAIFGPSESRKFFN